MNQEQKGTAVWTRKDCLSEPKTHFSGREKIACLNLTFSVITSQFYIITQQNKINLTLETGDGQFNPAGQIQSNRKE